MRLTSLRNLWGSYIRRRKVLTIVKVASVLKVFTLRVKHIAVLQQILARKDVIGKRLWLSTSERTVGKLQPYCFRFSPW